MIFYFMITSLSHDQNSFFLSYVFVFINFLSKSNCLLFTIFWNYINLEPSFIKLHLIMKEFLLQLNCIPHCTRSYTLSLYKVVISGCIFVCPVRNSWTDLPQILIWEVEILKCVGRLLKQKFCFPVKIEDLRVNGGNNYEHPVSAVQLQRMYFISNQTFSIYSTFSPI